MRSLKSFVIKFENRPWGEKMATHSSILAWKNPMDRGAWQATVHGSQKVGHD